MAAIKDGKLTLTSSSTHSCSLLLTFSTYPSLTATLVCETVEMVRETIVKYIVVVRAIE